MSLEKFLAANKEHEQLTKIVQSVNSVIFGDMETENKHIRSSDAPPEMIQWFESRLLEQRKQFMRQMLKKIDDVDEEVLELQ